MIKAIILDDEINCVQVLAYELGRIEEDVDVIATYTDPEKALELIPRESFDVLFLDIEMPGLNAFQFLDKLGPISAKIIFTTAYDQFALKAFRYYAVDYLLKPVSSDDLTDALSRIDQKSISMEKEVLEEIYTRISFPQTSYNKIAIPVNNGFQMINISDIVFCEADSNYSKIHMNSKKTLIISKPLKYLNDLLISHGFYRIHQSALINLKYLIEYSRADGGVVTLEGGKMVSVSRANKKDFEKFISSRY